MSNPVPEGYYKDSNGDLQPDRRGSSNRRQRDTSIDGDRRNMMRRKSDSEFLKRKHEQQIEEALGDFAEEHDQT
ncbi:MAG: hypothetical protein VCD00_00150 [Candidatus Hydrogenedentota bacterium]